MMYEDERDLSGSCPASDGSAIGGALPDLCNDTLEASLYDKETCGAVPKKFPQKVDLIEPGESHEHSHMAESTEPQETIEDRFLAEWGCQITLLDCSIADLSILEGGNSSENILEELGLACIKQNVVQSSHPLFASWPAVASVPSQLLMPVILNSHGMSLGCLSGPSYGFETIPGNHPPRYETEPQLSEEEQIKIAKRLGLIHHLPCGIFDGSTKTRECVICMIDFSEGDKLRYLPCMHTYHTDCIDDWLMRSFTCPSCLQPVDAALLKTYETS